MSWLSWLRGFFKTEYEDPPFWRPERDEGGLVQITVGYHEHDHEVPGWWLGVGEVPVVRALKWGPYQTKEEAVEAARERVGDEGELQFWPTTWRVASQDQEDGASWSIYPELHQQPDSMEDALSIILDVCEPDDRIVLDEGRGSRELTVGEVRNLV